jgi:phage terminase large subunit-like protein
MRMLSLETENEIERTFRDMEFFEARRMNWAGHNPADTVFFELEPETLVVEGLTSKETSKKRLNRKASIAT